MKKENFRIGNYLQDAKGRLCNVDALGTDWNDDGVEATAIDGPLTTKPVEPIPLTAEWLEKLGFSPAFHKISGEHSHLPTWYNLNGFQIDVSYFCGGENVCDYTLNMNPSTELLYVHQLQNLYFALTGEELTIKIT